MNQSLVEIENIFAKGDTALALKLLVDFLKLHPDNCRAINDMGIIQQKLGNTNEAINCFHKALSLKPDDTTSLRNLSLALAADGNWAMLVEQVHKLLRINQNDATMWSLLAKAELSLGNKKSAIAHMEKSLLIDERQTDLRQALNKLRQEMNQAAFSEHQHEKPSLLMCCPSGMEGFALDLCHELEKHINIKSVVANNLGPLTWPIKEAQNIWLEWGSQMSVAVSHSKELLQGKKKVILRLHCCEILNGQAQSINYSHISDLVFVSNYMRNLFFQKYPAIVPPSTRVHVVHNGIFLQLFPFQKKSSRKKIAFIGKLEQQKNPMLMLNAFHFLKQQHQDLEMHVAGSFDQHREYISITDWISKNKLQNDIKFYGHVSDIAGWLKDKDFILCTSPFESQGVGLLEAMHAGLRPLICSFPGAEYLYPPDCLWNNLEELNKMINAGANPEQCSRFVADYYSMERQALNFVKILTENKQVIEASPVNPIAS